jgi:predicted secreted hydrolase
MAKLRQTIRAYRPVVVALLVGLIGLGGGLAALRGARRSPDDTQLGLPGKRFGRLMLPHDDRMHTDADTEWWYFTGHLEADDGQRYGYELCAIKAYNDPSRLGPLTLPRSYEVDFAITDQAAGKFFSSVRMMLALPIYRMNERRMDVHYGRTRIRAIAPFTYRLRTHRGRQALDLIVRAIKPPLAQGDDGWVEMGTGGGSYYSSITRLETSGRLTVEGETKQVRGLSWMDHQWGCWDWSGVSGWDWLSIQLENGTDLMAFVFRGGGGQVATLYRSDGSVLTIRDYTLNSTGEWTSPVTGATYPSGWRLTIPEVQAELDVTPVLENQEVVNKDYPDGTYWEGSNTVEGTIEAHPTSGKAYVELTGYVRPLNE